MKKLLLGTIILNRGRVNKFNILHGYKCAHGDAVGHVGAYRVGYGVGDRVRDGAEVEPIKGIGAWQSDWGQGLRLGTRLRMGGPWNLVFGLVLRLVMGH